jgi:hypothetical protein
MKKYKNDDAQMLSEIIGHDATIKLILGLAVLVCTFQKYRVLF